MNASHTYNEFCKIYKEDNMSVILDINKLDLSVDSMAKMFV